MVDKNGGTLLIQVIQSIIYPQLAYSLLSSFH